MHAVKLTLRKSAAANVNRTGGIGRAGGRNVHDSRVRGHRSDGFVVSVADLHLDVGKAAPSRAEVGRDQGGGRPADAGRAALYSATRTRPFALQQGRGG